MQDHEGTEDPLFMALPDRTPSLNPGSLSQCPKAPEISLCPYHSDQPTVKSLILAGLLTCDTRYPPRAEVVMVSLPSPRSQKELYLSNCVIDHIIDFL